jgi:hypothetical protein
MTASYRWSPQEKRVAYYRPTSPKRNRLPATMEIERLRQLGELMTRKASKANRSRIPRYVMCSRDRTDFVVDKQFAYWGRLIEERGWKAAESEVRDQLIAIVCWVDQVYGPRQSYELFAEMADAFVGLEFERAEKNKAG